MLNHISAYTSIIRAYNNTTISSQFCKALPDNRHVYHILHVWFWFTAGGKQIRKTGLGCHPWSWKASNPHTCSTSDCSKPPIGFLLFQFNQAVVPCSLCWETSGMWCVCLLRQLNKVIFLQHHETKSLSTPPPLFIYCFPSLCLYTGRFYLVISPAPGDDRRLGI